MKIHGNPDETNFDESLLPLFEAMKAGKVIASVTCMKGTMNKNNREFDFEIKDFTASDYWVSAGSSNETGLVDYIDTDKRSFYMNWIIKFEI